jgi:nickel-dependent lactate racemase
MLYYESHDLENGLPLEKVKEGLISALEKLGDKKRVLIIPPDFTRFHSFAGNITCFAWEYYGNKITDILPALGTHVPMTKEEIEKMYPGIPLDIFRVHDWRNDIVTVGEVPSEFVLEVSEGKLDFTWPAQVNKMLLEGNYDLILSVGQVVPHEVVGMANFNKNIFVGTGGSAGINKSHYLGAVYGMERMMGRANTPVRAVLNYASRNFTNHLPIVYAHTVVGKDKLNRLQVVGLFVGDDEECFEKASEASLQANFKMLDEPLEKVVVYLDPEEYKTTWLGNKSVYRTRMAIADDGELIVLAPGVKEFGEDKIIDKLIRKYGYCGTDDVLEFTRTNEDLQNNLGAAAHLIHGSSEGRFSITYCPGYLTQDEVEQVNYKYADLKEMTKKYDPLKLQDGFNEVDGERIFYISNPALGLWAFRDRFK